MYLKIMSHKSKKLPAMLETPEVKTYVFLEFEWKEGRSFRLERLPFWEIHLNPPTLEKH